MRATGWATVETQYMRRRSALAAAITLAGVLAAFAWLWIGPGSYQPCRPAPPWDDLAVWLSGSLGAGGTDGPAGVPAFCEIPTDFTWIIALAILTAALSVAGFVVTARRSTSRRDSHRILYWWVVAVGGLTGLVATLTWFGHEPDEKEGGLEIVLSNAGCLGGGPGQPTDASCARTEWLYLHWWVWPLGVLIVGLLIGLVVALVVFTTSQDHVESDDEPIWS